MKIDEKSLLTAIKRFDGMTLKEQEQEADELFVQQPNLLASVLVQLRMGNSAAQMDELLRLLIVLHLALKTAKVAINTVSEQDLEQSLARTVATLQFTNALPEPARTQAITDYADKHPERYAFAFAYDILVSSGIVACQQESSKFLVLTALNMVNCIADAKTTR